MPKYAIHLLPVDIRAYKFIYHYKLTHGGHSPTLREIAEATKVSIGGHVYNILYHLEMAGWIKLQHEGSWQRLRIELTGEQYTAPDLSNTKTIGDKL
jgi:hypothetical protein